jgi:CHAT domain-containing protein
MTSLKDLTRLADDFRKGQNLADRAEFQRRFLQPALQELWTTIMSPIKEALFSGVLKGSVGMPRVWWCPTGPLTFLPIHAAGPYTKTGGPDLTKLLVSSYTNTLRALAKAKTRTRSTNSPVRMVIIGQSSTPGQTELPNSRREVRLIRDKALALQIPFVNLEDSDATISAVSDILRDVKCIHFACHGHQDQSPAIESALLHDGPLQLSTIASYRLPDADFAFLSACHSASGVDRLGDESLHIAAGMQVAGFRSVIATMWAITDSSGPVIIDQVYEHLFRNCPEAFDSSDAAEALNSMAVRNLRRSKVPLYQWIPFIHIGV